MFRETRLCHRNMPKLLGGGDAGLDIVSGQNKLDTAVMALAAALVTVNVAVLKKRFSAEKRHKQLSELREAIIAANPTLAEANSLKELIESSASAEEVLAHPLAVKIMRDANEQAAAAENIDRERNDTDKAVEGVLTKASTTNYRREVKNSLPKVAALAAVAALVVVAARNPAALKAAWDKIPFGAMKSAIGRTPELLQRLGKKVTNILFSAFVSAAGSGAATQALKALDGEVPNPNVDKVVATTTGRDSDGSTKKMEVLRPEPKPTPDTSQPANDESTYLEMGSDGSYQAAA